MERITTRFHQGMKGYWRRRRYERLGGNSRAGSGIKRFWRLRMPRKLKLKLSYSPKKLITGIRDGYVNMMMRMANSPVVAGTGGYGEAKFGMKPKEYVYDEKVVMEIYKTLVMRRAQLVRIDAPPAAVSR